MELEALLEVPLSLDDTYQEAMGTIRWRFIVEEYPVEPEDPKPPVTGEQSMIGWYVAAFGAGRSRMHRAAVQKKGKAEALRTLSSIAGDR